ncbi:DUF3219 family protein [Niallia circulans]|uniref:DUF3219 family protein n=1 Tax=Niallia circulans TaxID=1397 RepID=A0A553SPU8_NIACI|nr:DUF3219 family protein [Niallia circulans]TRZ38997.1 DUF3219 family protein [Niallia circulans]
MVNKIKLNDTEILVKSYKEELKDGHHSITVVFDVGNEDYHAITTLLYKNDFHVTVPEPELSFAATIQQYSTSVTNLYEKGNVGEFTLTLLEKRKR